MFTHNRLYYRKAADEANASAFLSTMSFTSLLHPYFLHSVRNNEYGGGKWLMIISPISFSNFVLVCPVLVIVLVTEL